MKKFKNNKQSADTWTGMTIQPGAYYEALSEEISRWQNDSKVLSDIGAGNLIINNGSNDITDVASAINFLKDTLDTRDSDNSIISRPKVAPLGWTYQHHSFEFSTSTLNSLYHKHYDLTDFNFVTLKFYKDENGTECSDQTDADANCIKTVADWEPTHDYELIGGKTNWAAALTQDVYLWTVGVPDISYAYGGTKEMISCCCLKHFSGLEVVIDGRASKRMTYNATYHTNKLRFIFRHPVGFKFNPQVILEFYKL